MFSDDAIVVSFGSVEVVEEVLEDLVTGLAALEELWVHANIVDAGNVADGELAGAISVHHLESLVDHGHATWSQLVSVLNSIFKLVPVLIVRVYFKVRFNLHKPFEI